MLDEYDLGIQTAVTTDTYPLYVHVQKSPLLDLGDKKNNSADHDPTIFFVFWPCVPYFLFQPRIVILVISLLLINFRDVRINVKKCTSTRAVVTLAGCGLLLSEIFLDEGRTGPSRGLLQALSMSEGRQRSADEYALLLKSHAFVATGIKQTENLLDAMLCIKV